MASILQQKCLTFKAAGAMARGTVVKMGADREHVAICSASTDKSIGLNQTKDVTNAEDKAEIALPGGGGFGLAGGTIAAGDLLTSNAAGKLVATTTAADRYVAVAMESAVANDIFAVHVVIGLI